MGAYLVRRILVAIPSIVGVVTVVFLIVRLIPGDPAQVMAGETATPEAVERIRVSLGLDLPLLVQYGRFLLNCARGDLGTSIASGQPVVEAIAQRLPYTLALAVLATVLGILFGLTLGLVAALRRRTLIDVLASALAVSGMSMPTYWLGLMLVILFAVNLRWLPAAGASEPRAFILPALTLATLSTALIARMSRGAMLEVLSQDYVRTAHAKGIPRGWVLLRHSLPNALPPIITVVALQFGALLGGAVLTETIFSWPGTGRLLIDAILARDYPVIQGCVLVFSLGFIAVNIVADVLYAAADPRIRYS